MRLTVSVFGVNFTFGLGAAHPESEGSRDLVDVLEIVRIRMSLEHAKVLAMMVKKQIKEYEKGTNTEVAIPQAVLDALGLNEQTW
jgi:hypothetical protein